MTSSPTAPAVLLVSHDAGGAEILAAWRRKNKESFSFQHCLEGPARRVFARHFGALDLVGLEAIDRLTPGSWILTGTSLEANLERDAIARSRSQGTRCVSFLDHWDLYTERFGSLEGWRSHLPDEVWAGDSYARDKALRDGFPPERLRLVDNPCFEWIRSLAPARSDVPGGQRVLYICEPVSLKLKAAFGPGAAAYDDEVTNVRKFLKSLGGREAAGWTATLRPHPLEKPAKYEALLTDAPAGSVAVSREPDLLADLRAHDVVVGVESMGLVIALLLGKDVFSCVTGKPYEISLPHRELKRITAYEQLFAAVKEPS